MQSDNSIKERLVALTRDLILIPSDATRSQERRRCYEFIRNHIETLDHIEVKEFEDQGIPSLVALPPGCSSPDILMCAHLDVITHSDISVYRSHIQDGRIYGPGSGDMKGALAILMEVFRRVHTDYPDASLGLTITADEETGGVSGIGYLAGQQGLRCATAMIPDGGSLNEITVDEKGILHLRLECRGHSAHAARPWLTQNPLEFLMNKLSEVQKFFTTMEQDDHWSPTCAITVVGTENQTINRIPTQAYAILDIRFPPPHTVKSMLKEVQAKVGPEVTVKEIISAEPTHLSPDPLYQEITEKITGQPVTLIRDHGGSDARYLTGYGIPVMMSRPLVGNLHAEDEWIDIASMVQFYQIYDQYLRTKLSLTS